MSSLALGAGAATASAEDADKGPEIVVGVGLDDFDPGTRDTRAATFLLQGRTAPLYELFGVELRVAGAIDVDTDGDFYGGVGPEFLLPIYGGLRAEFSVLAGGYIESETILGHPFEFRSQFSLSYEFIEGVRIGGAVSHKSNAGFSDVNPGVNTVHATLGFEF